MNDAAILKRHPAAVSAEVGDEIIFLHEGDRVYYSLDGVGAFLWNALADPRSFGDLVQLVLAEYEIGEAELREDLIALGGELVDKGLLVLESD